VSSNKRKGNPSKDKGTRYEREAVNEARARGLCAERAYASDGRALGERKEVDVLVQGMRISLKRRKKIAEYLSLKDGVDGVMFRQDNGKSLVLLRWEDLLDKLKEGW